MTNGILDVMATTAGVSYPTQTTNFSTSLFENESMNCDVMFENFLVENRLVFGAYHVVRIVVTWSIFIISTVGNTAVLASVTFRRTNAKMNHIQLMMLHLSLANLTFTFFILPMDAFWQLTLQWRAGDLLCRILNMLKQFSMYISSAVIIVMVIDRVTSLLRPVTHAKQKQRIRRMLTFAWIFSFLNSIPALVMFSADPYWPQKKECPEDHIVQCVDFKLVNGTELRVFYFHSMSLSFFIPLICIIVCYVIIAIWLRNMGKAAKAVGIRSSDGQANAKKKSLAQKGLAKAKKISLIVAVLITAVFIICWGPYYVVGFIHWYKKKKPDIMIEAVMIMCSYMNPCLHPLITVMLLKDISKDLKCMLSCVYKPSRSPTSAATRKAAQ